MKWSGKSKESDIPVKLPWHTSRVLFDILRDVDVRPSHVVNMALEDRLHKDLYSYNESLKKNLLASTEPHIRTRVYIRKKWLDHIEVRYGAGDLNSISGVISYCLNRFLEEEMSKGDQYSTLGSN